MHQIRFAIVGCGRIAEKHALQARTYGELLAVCDLLKERADDFSERYQTKKYYSIEALLQAGLAIDVVVICTPNGLHASQSIQALAAGYHVLVEKPMAITVADCNKMMEAAILAGKQIFTVMQNRFNPPVLALKKAIEQKALGRIYSFQISCFWNRPADYYHDSWHGTELDGGVLYTQFSHFIDLVYWLFGDLSSVKALTQNYAHQGLMQGEDTGVVLLEMQNGTMGSINYSVNAVDKNAEGSLTIIAEKSTLKIGGAYLNSIVYETGEKVSEFAIQTEQPPNDYGTYQGSMSNHHKVYESLVQALQANLPYYASAEEGLKAVEIIEKIYRSAKNGNHAIPTETS